MTSGAGGAVAAALREQPLATALRAALAHKRDAVLQAPTGAGKSTQVPLALLSEPWLDGRKILMLEPRRVAARAVAARMAALLGEPVGETIGYRMRLDTRVSRSTRVEVVTEGVLTRLLQQDPALEGVGCVIFDEFHERSLQADLGLALCLDARRQLEGGFRILIMSATIETAPVLELLRDAASVAVPGRAFPVAVHYLGRGAPLLPAAGSAGTRDAPQLHEASARAVRRALAESGGDVLVFQPGAAAIHRLATALSDGALPANVQLLSLYGQMSGAEQDAALAPAAAGMRKVVLATNIAETSLTIPGVTAVVDSGLVRRSQFDPVTGMSRLTLTRISRAASEQRCGRAGRVAAGVCYRLWSEAAHGSLAATTPPEILDADLSAVALELARWGVSDARRLDWLDAPPEAMLSQARATLRLLGALDEQRRLTPTGGDMARLPLHPRLAAMLLHAGALPQRRLACELAALLSERDLLRDQAAPNPDLAERIELLRQGGRGAALQRGVERGVRERLARQAQALEQAVRQLPQRAGAEAAARIAELTADDALGTLLALGFPDRIGQRREGAAGRYLLANGRGAAFAQPSSLSRAEFIVAAALDDGAAREARIDLAAALSREGLERLFADRITTQQSLGWDARQAAVLWHRTRRFEALVLEDQIRPAPEGAATVEAMLEGVRSLGLEALPWEPELRNLQARLEFVRRLDRSDTADWPASDEAGLMAALEAWLAPWLAGLTRREHLSRLNLAQALLSRLDGGQRRLLEQLAPREIVAPSGSRLPIDYLDANAPCVEVRLQEVFGLAATPSIGGGAVPVTFKLLSPAQRPVQITRDLAGFWRSSYAEVRKDMRGRYPKHDWPENPLEARPTRGPPRRRARRAP